MLKEEKKIRKLLDYKRYHLHTTSEGEWQLFKKYEDLDTYYSKKNKAIMTNETHTEEDLLKFAKEHKKYSLGEYHNTYSIIIFTLGWIFIILGWIVNGVFAFIALGVYINHLISTLIWSYQSSRNIEVEFQENIEEYRRYLERMKTQNDA